MLAGKMDVNRPMLFMVTGPSGVGKSTVAQLIARRLMIKVFSTDVIHQLSKFRRYVLPHKRNATRLFPYWLRQQFYQTLTQLGARELKKGRNVVLDATFSTDWTRRYAQRLAKKFHARLIPIEVQLSGLRRKTIERRLMRRYQRTAGAAPPHLHWLYRKKFAPIRGRHYVIQNSGTRRQLQRQTIRLLYRLKFKKSQKRPSEPRHGGVAE